MILRNTNRIILCINEQFHLKNNHIKYKKFCLVSPRLTNKKVRHHFDSFVLNGRSNRAKWNDISVSGRLLRTWICLLRDHHVAVRRDAIRVAYPPQDLREDLPEPLRSLNREDITDARVQRRDRHAELGVGKVEDLREDGGEQIAPRLLQDVSTIATIIRGVR